MRTRLVTATGALLVAGLILPTSARAQYGYKVPSDQPAGENYHVEATFDFWFPQPGIVFSSESIGIPGTDIDLVLDLGATRTRFNDFRIVVRPGRKHKFRFEYTPIKYQTAFTLEKTLIFNGIAYTVGLPVEADFFWKAWRLGYEWDFISRDRGFVGVIFEAKWTDIQAELRSLIAQEYARAKAPVPAIGGIGRVYVTRSISATFELSGFELPQSLSEDYRARYIEYDLYGTVNFTDNFAAQAGYRNIGVTYLIEQDQGDLNVGGWYFGGTVRF